MIQKSLRFFSLVNRNSSKDTLPVNEDKQESSLPAETEKLKKKKQSGRLPKWLHKDVKIKQKITSPELTDLDLTQLATQSFTNTDHNISSLYIYSFSNECIERIGMAKFKKFVEFNELYVPKLKYADSYYIYLKKCYEMFKYDSSLIKLLAMFSLKSINQELVAKIILKKKIEKYDEKPDEDLKILKLLPEEKPIFDYQRDLEKDIAKI